jgi:hypothetical protein
MEMELVQGVVKWLILLFGDRDHRLLEIYFSCLELEIESPCEIAGLKGGWPAAGELSETIVNFRGILGPSFAANVGEVTAEVGKFWNANLPALRSTRLKIKVLVEVEISLGKGSVVVLAGKGDTIGDEEGSGIEGTVREVLETGAGVWDVTDTFSETGGWFGLSITLNLPFFTSAGKVWADICGSSAAELEESVLVDWIVEFGLSTTNLLFFGKAEKSWEAVFSAVKETLAVSLLTESSFNEEADATVSFLVIFPWLPNLSPKETARGFLKESPLSDWPSVGVGGFGQAGSSKSHSSLVFWVFWASSCSSVLSKIKTKTYDHSSVFFQ